MSALAKSGSEKEQGKPKKEQKEQKKPKKLKLTKKANRN